MSILVRSAADVRGPRLRRIGLISPIFIFGTVWVRRRDGLGVFGTGGGRERMWILIARWWRIRCGGWRWCSCSLGVGNSWCFRLGG